MSAATTVTGDRPTPLPDALLERLRQRAPDLDRGAVAAREAFCELGEAGLLDLGAPENVGGGLADMAQVIAAISSECLSTGFAVWANRMTLEYLLAASTSYALDCASPLRAGRALGVTAMASAFREIAGCGSLEVEAAGTDGGGWVLNGRITWASNLYDDSVMVTAARSDQGQRIVVALPLRSPGVSVGENFSLLALGATASSFLGLDGVEVDATQVLSVELDQFLRRVRPTFLVLQTALCVGLARTSLAESKGALRGLNVVFGSDVERLACNLAEVEGTMLAAASAVGSSQPPGQRDLLALRLAGAELASAATALEAKMAGGRGYASGTPAGRRFREAAFIPVQSPSEAQLRWELSKCG